VQTQEIVLQGIELQHQTQDAEITRMLHAGVVFCPNGKFIVSGNLDATARVWDWQIENLIAD